MLDFIKKVKENKIVGFTASSFDLLHTGHILMLSEIKQQCDFLIVALQDNPNLERDSKNKPIETIFERWIKLNSCKYIDYIIPYSNENDLLNILNILKPHKRFLGIEYKNTQFTGYDIKEIEIIFNSREHNYSSTSIRNRISNIEKKTNHNNDNS